jgi:hypothetical protein
MTRRLVRDPADAGWIGRSGLERRTSTPAAAVSDVDFANRNSTLVTGT